MLTVGSPHFIVFLCVLAYLHGKRTVQAMYRQVTHWFVPFATKWFLKFIGAIPCLRTLRKTTSSPVLSTSHQPGVSSLDRMMFIHWLVRLFQFINAGLMRVMDRFIPSDGQDHLNK
jgi:hypothetical protein